LVGGGELDEGAAGGEFGVELVDVGHPEEGVGFSGAVGFVGLEVEVDAVAGEADVAWVGLWGVGGIGEGFLEAEGLAVVGSGAGGIGDGDDGDGGGEH